MSDSSKTRFEQQIVGLTEQLLKAIFTQNIDEYRKLCDASLTAIEPETFGRVIRGLEFHELFMRCVGRPNTTVRWQILHPTVHALGDGAAVIAYEQLVQFLDPSLPNPSPKQSLRSVTRVWHRQSDGQWRTVHFHSSKHVNN
eukprot:TRINITY_DN18533_c0_g1_i1.p1 TRINITY_DN18533_c0_g1~~TRINITY_DN18533_c0_g1_i1.p1  ORF type:complete len:142 (+),score=47.85 TRINITY_DN18533_c0_g1_i1:2-427(+)